MFNRIRKMSVAAALGIALSASAFSGVGTADKAEAQVFVGGGYVAYTGPYYWWWPVWPANFYWPVYIPQPRYAAIAVGHESGRIGLAYGQWAPEDSAVQALGYCGADDCESLVWVGEGCAAYSRASNGNFGWAWSDAIWSAQSASIRNCQAAGGPDCRVAAYVCSNGLSRINR